jgi:hypothetical protein
MFEVLRVMERAVGKNRERLGVRTANLLPEHS